MTEPNNDLVEELLKYVRKRDEILLSLNLNEAREFFPALEPKDDHFILLTLHKMRYECVQLPREARIASGVWLLDRGYHRMRGDPVRLFEDLSYVH